MKKYKIIYQKNQNIKELILECNDINIEKKPKNILKIIELKRSFDFNYFKKIRVDDKSLNLLFYELNLMLSSNINIADAIDILIKNKKDKNVLLFLESLKNSFIEQNSVKNNFDNFRINPLFKQFSKILFQGGDIALNIEAISKLLIEINEIKKRFYKAISYPIFLLITFFISLLSIFLFVVPNFKTIFMQSQSELPLATELLLKFEYFFVNYYLLFILSILFLSIVFYFIYKKSLKVEYFIDKILINNIFLLKDINLSLQLYKLFLLIEIMQKSQFEFHKCFKSSKVLLENKYLLDKIYIIDNFLENGKSINISFCESKIFDDIVLNLINTGEVSNSLPLVISEIKMIYKNRFDERVGFLISLIQPTFLVFIMILILWIVIAIFVPIWDMGNIIK
ncbi:type II secretion/transformation system, F protein [Aliarcobacter faecis]|uniref:type II secretion system F family protein n=1 Tax=Aliarcobacter faecis TaxID=1564138 RepID=UPI000479A98A|nr:type II secretion system F family protein [Aliarcobacter faecis]QKF73894.1 type II secretion/transformation system, F protein [Aliarcobacter faecis]